MSVCQHRPEDGGMWTSCSSATHHGCPCGKEVEAEIAAGASRSLGRPPGAQEGCEAARGPFPGRDGADTADNTAVSSGERDEEGEG